MLLLPVVFILHEYEEIIMFRHWLDRNRDELKRRFPKFERFLARRRHFDYSTATICHWDCPRVHSDFPHSFCAVWLGAYQWWFAAFTGYSFHLIVHLAQWTIYRKYIPVIITTFLTLPYCVYAFVELEKTSILSPLQMFLWSVIGIILTVLSYSLLFS